MLSRRGFLGGLAALVAAPAIVPVEKLMQLPPRRFILSPAIDRMDVLYGFLNVRPEWAMEVPANWNPQNNHLTINMITREAVRLFKNSNVFIKNIETQYDEHFESSTQIGARLRLKMLEEAGEISDVSWRKLSEYNPLPIKEIKSPQFQVKKWDE